MVVVSRKRRDARACRAIHFERGASAAYEI